MEYNSSSVIEQLENVEGLHPIVIFLTAKSRKLRQARARRTIICIFYKKESFF